MQAGGRGTVPTDRRGRRRSSSLRDDPALISSSSAWPASVSIPCPSPDHFSFLCSFISFPLFCSCFFLLFVLAGGKTNQNGLWIDLLHGSIRKERWKLKRGRVIFLGFVSLSLNESSLKITAGGRGYATPRLRVNPGARNILYAIRGRREALGEPGPEERQPALAQTQADRHQAWKACTTVFLSEAGPAQSSARRDPINTNQPARHGDLKQKKKEKENNIVGKMGSAKTGWNMRRLLQLVLWMSDLLFLSNQAHHIFWVILTTDLLNSIQPLSVPNKPLPIYSQILKQHQRTFSSSNWQLNLQFPEIMELNLIWDRWSTIPMFEKLVYFVTETDHRFLW